MIEHISVSGNTLSARTLLFRITLYLIKDFDVINHYRLSITKLIFSN